MERRHDATRHAASALLVASLLLWAGANGAHAQVQISCPTTPPGVWIPNPGWCGFDVNPVLNWPAGFCGCEKNLFRVDCGYGLAGAYVDGVIGCYVSCSYYQTDIPCATDVERSGRPPGTKCPHCPPYEAGQPVSLTTGEMSLTHVDATVGELSFSRSYNSSRVYPLTRYGGFGKGWNTSFEARLRFASATVIEARDGSGQPVYYLDHDGDGVFEQELPYGKDTWIDQVGGLYLLHSRSGGVETYLGGSGEIVSSTDAAGVTTTYARDGLGRLTGVTRRGRTLTIAYLETSSQPSQISGPDGQVLASYRYDIVGRLDAVDYPDGAGYRYGYDGDSHLLWVANALGQRLETHAYDGQGRAITSEIGDGRDKLSFSYTSATGTQTTLTDALGNATVYEWADVRKSYRIIKVTGPCSSCGGTGGDTQEWSYDADGNVASYKDGAGKLSTYSYSPEGDLLTETDPLSRVTTYTYDSQGRMLTRTGPDGAVTTYTQGPAGPLTITETVTASESRTTAISYSPEGKPATITDPRGKQTSLSYNGTGDLTSVTDPLSHTTSFGYDALGRRTTVTDALGHTTTTAYDARGRVTRITSHDGTHTDFAYDKAGRRTSVTDPLGKTTRYAYEAYGRLSHVVDAINGATKYGYDLMGNLTTLTDAKNQTTAFEYDAHKRVKKVIYPGGAFESFTYDVAGRLATKTDRKNVTTSYSYDDLGRLLGKSYSDGTTPPVSYTYDTAGRLQTAANGTDTLTWTYDLAGQLLGEQSSKNASTVAYTYEAAGNRLSASLDGQLFVSYGYDDASRLTTITRGSNVFGFAYDNANRRTSMTYPNGVTTSYVYDTLNRLTSLQAVHVPTSTPITSFGYTYDAAGNRTRKQQLDYTEDYQYDPLYRLTGVERSAGLAGLSTYSYDAVGNRLTKQQDGSVTTNSYNEKNQLLAAAGGGLMLWRGTLDEPGNVSFTSATVNGKPAKMLPGNVFEAMLPMTPGPNAVTLEARDTTGNVATKTYDITVSGDSATYSYDANGNLTQKVEGTDVWAYEWNAENLLTRVTKNGAEAARFAYDPLGRRVEKVGSATGTSAYAYDGEDILRLATGSGTTKYVHGPGIDEPLASEDGSGGLSYLTADGLGSIAATTNAAGGLASATRYDVWGNVESGSPSPYGFTGREPDAETGLGYYRARYYDPQRGRFISEDPSLAARSPNGYPYVDSSPATFLDPLGLNKIDPSRRAIVPTGELLRRLRCVENCIRREAARRGSPDPELRTTSTSEPTPAHKPGDAHMTGMAADVTVIPRDPFLDPRKVPGGQNPDVMCCARECGFNNPIDHYNDPRFPSVYPHYHLAIPPGPGGFVGGIPTAEECRKRSCPTK